MLKELFRRAVSAVCAAVMLTAFSLPLPSAAADGTVTVAEQPCDKTVIPDSLNTGAKGALTKISGDCTAGGIEFKKGSDGVNLILDFVYRNLDVSGDVIIENFDFTDFTVNSRTHDPKDREVRLIFKNCKFDGFDTTRTESTLSFVFENCSFVRYYGSNTDFSRCFFGGSAQDPLRPYQNVTVTDCYFSDMDHYLASADHSDCTQMYGETDVDVTNVRFTRCRFEMPPLYIENSKATFNACIMLQMENSNAHGLIFEDCILNGGGDYSIYAHTKSTKEGEPPRPWLVTDTVFRNIKIGCARNLNAVYPDVSPYVTLDNLSDTDKLYVSTVTRENGRTAFTVTNDTNIPRKLRIVTSKQTYEYLIPACPTGTQLKAQGITSLSQLPVDKQITISEECSYAVCFDVTFPQDITQIRFVNYTGKPVTVDKLNYGTDEDTANNVLYSGTAKDGITYTLTTDHTLIISGTGALMNFHSRSDPPTPPWAEYNGMIKKIIVEGTVSRVGSMAFQNLYAVEEVIIKEGVTSLGGRLFTNDHSLRTVVIPKSAVDLDDRYLYGIPEKTKVTVGRLLGDVNLDGIITADDAVITARYAAGYSNYRDRYDLILCDVNEDGSVTADDAVIIARTAADYSDYRSRYTKYV